MRVLAFSHSYSRLAPFMQKILFILLLAATSLAQDAAALTFSELPGPYAVGLRVVQQYDYTRIYRGKTNLMNGLPTCMPAMLVGLVLSSEAQRAVMILARWQPGSEARPYSALK